MKNNLASGAPLVAEDMASSLSIAKPLVSVIMPLFNHEHYVGAAIKSIVKQTYQNWELIIIDDGSTDGSAKVAAPYVKKDKRVRYYYQANRGEYSARNHGLRKARGQYVAWQDADDVAHPERLRLQIAFLEKNNDYGGVGCWLRFIDNHGQSLADGYRPDKIRSGPERLHTHYLFLHGDSHYGNHPTFMVRKTMMDKVGGFRHLRLGTDRDMAFRMDEQQPLAMIKRELYFYRQHEDSSQHRVKKNRGGGIGRRLEFSLGNCAYFLSAMARRHYGRDPLAGLPLSYPLARPRLLLLFWRMPRLWRHIPAILLINRMSLTEFMARLMWLACLLATARVRAGARAWVRAGVQKLYLSVTKILPRPIEDPIEDKKSKTNRIGQQ